MMRIEGKGSMVGMENGEVHALMAHYILMCLHQAWGHSDGTKGQQQQAAAEGRQTRRVHTPVCAWSVVGSVHHPELSMVVDS